MTQLLRAIHWDPFYVVVDKAATILGIAWGLPQARGSRICVGTRPPDILIHQLGRLGPAQESA